MDWKDRLKKDPVPLLLDSQNPALRLLAQRDLIGTDPGPVEDLWRLSSVQRLFDAQTESGAWKYHGGREHIRSREDYDQIETYRVLRELVEKYCVNRADAGLRKASEFLFSHQTLEGDFRGICGNQYIPYYSAAIMELLIKSGYSDDPRIRRGFDWLISMRQDDGGWAFPLRTVGRKLDPQTFTSNTIEPDRSKPFSHMVTGMVLRAFASHPQYRRSLTAIRASKLLVSRFFKADVYPDRRAPSFWTSFSFPFWFTDLLSALDAVSLIDPDPLDPQVARGLDWFAARQEGSGLWRLPLRIMAREKEADRWITLAICRIFKRIYG